MQLNRKTGTVLAGMAILILTGCKPTERNYESAYVKASEAARLKAEAERTGENGVRLESIDGPRIEKIGNDSIGVGKSRLRPFESNSSTEMGDYGIAIAKYSMPTNARRHLQDIREKYPEAFMANDGQDGYYVIIKRVPSIPEAAEPIKVYRIENPDARYMGLQDGPMVFYVRPE